MLSKFRLINGGMNSVESKARDKCVSDILLYSLDFSFDINELECVKSSGCLLGLDA